MTTGIPARAGPMVRNPKNLGGSDAAAICGKDPNKTAYSVAMRVLGKIESDDLEGLDHIEFGNEMEGVLARFYERKEKVTLYTPASVQHAKFPFLSANIDRVREDRMDIGIECKNTGLFTTEEWGDPGTDEVPPRVLLQCQHCMLVRPEIEVFHVLRCYGGNTYQKFIVPRSQRIVDTLFKIETEFYERVLAGDIPEPDWGHRTTKETIKKAFSTIEGDTIPAGAELEQLTVEWKAAAGERLRWHKEEEKLKNRIEFAIGKAARARLDDGRYWRRKEVERAGYTVEPTSYIECRLMVK